MANPVVDVSSLRRARSAAEPAAGGTQSVPAAARPAGTRRRRRRFIEHARLGALLRLGRRTDRPRQVAGQQPPLDYTLLGVTLVLTGVGAVMIYSASSVLAASKYESSTFFLVRHLVRVALGLGLLWAATHVRAEWIRKFSVPMLVAAVGLLVVLLVMKAVDPSGAAKGAYRWLRLPGVSFQPTELVKFAFIFFLADRLASQQGELSDFKRIVAPHFVLLGTALLLIVLQPDLSTAVAIALISGVIMLAAGLRIRHAAFLLAVMTAAVTALINLEPYRIRRILDFWLLSKLRGTEEQLSYQIWQGFVALGSGGLFGRGPGHSLQKYFFLPEPHTDSVFPILGEELGLIGTLGVVILFGVLGRQGLRIAARQQKLYCFLVAVGLTANIMIYATLNISVMLGLVPATGLPLPFLSYGGSAMLFNLGSVGLLLSLGRYAAEERAAEGGAAA